MYKHEINEEFISSLRSHLGTGTWNLDTTKQAEIVPNNLTHDYLLNNFNIDENIYKFYHLPTSRLLSDKEFKRLKDTGFAGKKETALRPYSNIIYGAYYSRSDLEFKLSGIIYSPIIKKIEGKKIKYLNDLIPYFKEYSKGFQKGFNEFDSIQIEPYLTLLAEKQDYIIKVFDFITKNLFLKRSWVNSISGFGTNQNNEIVNAFEDGQFQGYFYRAWSIVLSNNNLFAPLFAEHIKARPSQNSKFSVLEWATIFYYADETKLLTQLKTVKDRWERFMQTHEINTTSDTFKKNYYNAKKRINEKNNFPIDKLRLIIPFINEHYQQAVTKVENDITFLESEHAEY